jgi:UDPglucose 6-dehydrogenase
MRVAVLGTGHVGLITGAALASLEHDVVGMDLSAEKVAMLQRGEAPSHEPGLADLLRHGIETGRLRFTTSVREAVEDACVALICVGRPPIGQGDRSLTAVEGAVRELADAATPGIVLVVKSTVPPGTTGRIEEVVRRARPDLDFTTVSSPEFLREGHAVEDTLQPDRLVVGSDDARSFAVMRELYAPILAAGHPMIETDPRTAELSKLASNAFLATKISFINEIANVCEGVGADVGDVARGMGPDPRIGAQVLQAGSGCGGSCNPKDVSALKMLAGNTGYHFQLLSSVIEVNELQKRRVISKLTEHLGSLAGKRVALLGLAFKPNTDDMREASSLVLSARLQGEGATVVAYDPVAEGVAAELLPSAELRDSAAEALEGADAVILVTEWPEFAELDWQELAGRMANPLVVDGRNFLDPERMRAAGFTYEGIGRR